MNRTDGLVGEVIDVAALSESAFVGWWKLRGFTKKVIWDTVKIPRSHFI
jgi:hypothetical protein